MKTLTYTPSINIKRDFTQEINYILTPNVCQLFSQISSNYKKGSRSFNIVGAYGTGKSAFIVALEQSMSGQNKLFNNRVLFNETKSFDFINGYEKVVTQNQVDSLLKHVRLKHQSGKYPLELSGGEQQRVAMARALSHNPILILADEPTGNLDDYSSQLIWNLLEGANTQLKTTVIVVTHHIPESMNIDYKHFHIEYGSIHEVN